MTELESKIWDMTHRWCDGQYHKIPDQNRRYLMDEIKALILSNVIGQSEQLSQRPNTRSSLKSMRLEAELKKQRK